MKLTIIGGGNLGQAIAEGLLQSQFIEAKNLTVTRRNLLQLQALKNRSVNISANNLQATKSADIVLLAIKPFQIEAVLKEIKNELTKNKILVSVVTGVSLADIEKFVAKKLPIFRAMPNTAIAIQESMTCLCDINANEKQREIVSAIFNKLGKVVSIDEKLMEAATILGACGTAFAMRYIRANIQGGIEIGFSAATASLIAAQTVKGATELLLKHNTHPEQEIDKVTTPKGCTIAGLNEMEHQGFSSSLIRGLITSYKKIAKD